MQKYSIKYSILQMYQYLNKYFNTSILQILNTSIPQILQYFKYFNTSILQNTSIKLNLYSQINTEAFRSYPLVLPQFTTNY